MYQTHNIDIVLYYSPCSSPMMMDKPKEMRPYSVALEVMFKRKEIKSKQKKMCLIALAVLLAVLLIGGIVAVLIIFVGKLSMVEFLNECFQLFETTLNGYKLKLLGYSRSKAAPHPHRGSWNCRLFRHGIPALFSFSNILYRCECRTVKGKETCYPDFYHINHETPDFIVNFRIKCHYFQIYFQELDFEFQPTFQSWFEIPDFSETEKTPSIGDGRFLSRTAHYLPSP